MKLTKKGIRNIKIVLAALLPILLFYLEACFTYHPFARTRWKAQILNLVFLELVFLLLWMIIGKLSWALRIETISVLVIGLANYYVISFRGNPIVPWDILSIGTAASVAGGYSYALPLKQIILIAVFLMLIVAEGFLDIRLGKEKPKQDKGEAKPEKKTRKLHPIHRITGCKWYHRLVIALLALASVCGMTWMVQQDSYVSRLELYPFLFTPNVMYERNGFAVTFLMDLQYMSVEKPEGYSAKQAKQLLEAYPDSHSWTTRAQQTDPKDMLPNIIVIMDEAFSDVGVLDDFTSSEDYMPFIHKLQKGADNTITGYLNVSVKGGNTANTEFEFLTGSTMAYLPAGSIPYQQYITKEQPSLASYLKSLGYDTTAMHPYYASGWSRDKVYPLFGFDRFFDQTDYTYAGRVRGYIDDASCVDKIIEQYENKEAGKPSFLFTVTMQNHSPYTDGYVDPAGNISVSGSMSASLSEYLTLIKKSDAALEKLITYFEDQEEPTVIVFFGDHQPTDTVVSSIYDINGRSVQDLTTEEEAKRYEVPYVIWANYDIPEESGADTSANYLAADALRAAGVPLADYQNYLLKLQESYPIISAQRTVDANEEVVSGKSEELLQYQMLQYYLLFDKKED